MDVDFASNESFGLDYLDAQGGDGGAGRAIA
jgi:hypothetical protein